MSYYTTVLINAELGSYDQEQIDDNIHSLNKKYNKLVHGEKDIIAYPFQPVYTGWSHAHLDEYDRSYSLYLADINKFHYIQDEFYKALEKTKWWYPEGISIMIKNEDELAWTEYDLGQIKLLPRKFKKDNLQNTQKSFADNANKPQTYSDWVKARERKNQ